jgi:hypothetical protein
MSVAVPLWSPYTVPIVSLKYSLKRGGGI